MMSKEQSDGSPLADPPAIGPHPARLMVHGCAWGLLLVTLRFGVPRVEAILKDFGIPLPRATIGLIEASHALVRPGTSLAGLTLVLALVLACDTLMLQMLRGHEGAARAWSIFMLATPLCLIVLIIVAFGLPFFTIMTRLSG